MEKTALDQHCQVPKFTNVYYFDSSCGM